MRFNLNKLEQGFSGFILEDLLDLIILESGMDYLYLFISFHLFSIQNIEFYVRNVRN